MHGARIAVVNPYREPGLKRYWIPSIASSAVNGTAIADHWFDVHTGGDRAFLIGVLRALIERQGIDEAFVRDHTIGFDQARMLAEAATWDTIERDSGLTRQDIGTFAELLIAHPKTIFVWSMGLTQHAHGVETVKSLVNFALARGLPSRSSAGLVPIRGHSGVQGGAEVGCQPRVDAETRARWSAAWGFPVPETTGWTAAETVAHAADGAVDLFWIVGGNFLETIGDETRSRRALGRPRLRVHHDIVFTSSMLVEGEGDVLLLPATTRYESPGGGTETSTERRIIFSPEIPGRRIGSAKPEWWAFREVMARVRPDRRHLVGLEDAAAIRREIARAVPLYAGIETLASKGDQIQWGGRRLYADGRFATPDGKARFAAVSLPATAGAREGFTVSTRRGKQFNSMIQREIDPLNGAARHDILISVEDLAKLQMKAGSWVTLRSPRGSFTGRLVAAPIKSGNLEVHWPEGNVLLAADRLDPDSMEPDYNTIVIIEPVAQVSPPRS
jgi:molybdopterin-dependent oxidoreductase alpha subunit